MGYSGTGGKLIHEKTRSKKSCDTFPLKNAKTSSKHSYFCENHLTPSVFAQNNYKFQKLSKCLALIFQILTKLKL
jgi:hypothetical protein